MLDLSQILENLDRYLSLRSFFVGNHISVVDVDLFSSLFNVRRFCGVTFGTHLERWWTFLEGQAFLQTIYGKCWVVPQGLNHMKDIVYAEKKPEV